MWHLPACRGAGLGGDHRPPLDSGCVWFDHRVVVTVLGLVGGARGGFGPFVDGGYEFQAARGLVTIFSAPDYCGELGGRAAAR